MSKVEYYISKFKNQKVNTVLLSKLLQSTKLLHNATFYQARLKLCQCIFQLNLRTNEAEVRENLRTANFNPRFTGY